MQTVLTRTYLRWGRIEQDDPVGYARRAVVNEVTDRWRRHRGREVLRPEPMDQKDPYDAYEAVMRREMVLGLLQVLTQRERTVLVLRYWEDLTEAQTASVLGVAVGTVKSTTHRAFGKLRQARGLPTPEEARHE